MRRKFKNMNGKILAFLIMSVIMIVGHSLILFVEFGEIQGYLSIIPILCIAIQTSRMLFRGIEYDGWFNGEIKYATRGITMIGVLPILGFQIIGFTKISYWIGLGLFVLLIAYVILNLVKLFSVKASFYSDQYSLKEVEDVLNQKDLRYEKSEKKPNKITDIENTILYLPDHECRIFKIKEEIFVKPINWKTETKVFDVIDLIETNAERKG